MQGLAWETRVCRMCTMHVRQCQPVQTFCSKESTATGAVYDREAELGALPSLAHSAWRREAFIYAPVLGTTT
jgi:hypothetical protein